MFTGNEHMTICVVPLMYLSFKIEYIYREILIKSKCIKVTFFVIEKSKGTKLINFSIQKFVIKYYVYI